MISISDYDLVETIYEGTRTLISRGRHQATGRHVIVKRLRSDHPLPEDDARLRREYDIARSVNLPGVVRPLAMVPDGRSYALFLEDFGGESLHHLLARRRLELSEALQLSVKLAAILESLHRSGVIHKDVKPSNIIVDSSCETVKITDFGIASLLDTETSEPLSPRELEGTLTHMSPEQTGRMNRVIDRRTDFYSFGVTMYELLTGQLPFTTTEPMELIHSHIAKAPLPPAQMDPSIPQSVSDIVMKCLAKNAEDRYQSAYGLLCDLEHCYEGLLSSSLSDEFAIGTNDRKDSFYIPQRLYGREQELERLHAVYERLSFSESICVLVSGYSGIGKSSFILEMMKRANEDEGQFILGKFDSLRRHVPYSAFLQAFRLLIRRLASESGEELETKANALRSTLGEHAPVLAEVLPELEWILGPQPRVEPLPASEAKQRFHTAIRLFLTCFSAHGTPLILFLDDLQWADQGSLQLMLYLIEEAKLESFLIIGAYRDNELQEAHALNWLLGELDKKADAESIVLQALEPEDVLRMLCDTLNCGPEDCRHLAGMLIHKTGGNPFYLKQFLTELHRKGLLYFDYEEARWMWDSCTIRELNLSDHVLGMVGDKIEALPAEAVQVLRLASCIGFHFDLQQLAILAGDSQQETLDSLWEAIQAHLIMPIGTAYKFLPFQSGDQPSDSSTPGHEPIRFKFLHDKIREWCYEHVPVLEKHAIHLRLGRLLAERLEHQGDEALFETANHYNAGSALIEDQEEKERLAVLNLKAGRKAVGTAAYSAAAAFFAGGLDLLGEEGWHQRYDLAYPLQLGMMEADYLNGRFDEAKAQFTLLTTRARTHLDRAEAYNIMVIMLTNMVEHEAAVAIGMEGLRSLGLKLSSSPGRTDILLIMGKIRMRMGRKTVQDLLHLKQMTNEETMMLAKLMMNVGTPAYFVNANLYLYMLLQIVNLSLKHGNTFESSNAYNAYGLMIGSGFGQFTLSEEFGRLGVALSERFHQQSLKSKSRFTFAVFINPWKRHMRTSLDHLSKSFHAAMEAGDLVFASYAVTYTILMSDFLGVRLSQVQEDIRRQLPFVRQTHSKDTVYMLELLSHVLNNLQGVEEPSFVLAASPEEEAHRVKKLEACFNQVILQVYYMKKMKLYYMFERYKEALDEARRSQALVHVSLALFHTVEHYFYYALTLAAVIPHLSGRERLLEERRLRGICRKLKTWAEHCPDNYKHLYQLAEAERYRVGGNARKAEPCYHAAIHSARFGGFTQFEALAAERAARFYAQRGQDQVGKVYMAEAYQGYVRWGAKAKAKLLERMFPDWLLLVPPNGLGLSAHSTTTMSPISLDLAAIVKASQMISGEIVWEQLMQKLMRVVMLTAGATRGVFLMKEKDSLIVEVEAETTAEGEQIHILDSLPVTVYGKLPMSIVYYTVRTAEHLVLEDASSEVMFQNDPYVQNGSARSVFCLPVMYQGSVTAVLYLENSLATHAFTEERRTVIDILASQAAISLENARLYQHMEDKVRERTEEIRRMEESRRNLLSNISHDLGTPLTSIQGYVEALIDGVITEPAQQQKYLKVVHSRVLSIRRLIKDLFLLSKMETRQLQLSHSSCEAAELLQQLYQKHEIDAEQAGLRYELMLQEPLKQGGFAVIADPDRIGQVISNLVYNAIKHTPRGGCLRLVGGVSVDGGALLVQVTDTGSGIAQEDLPHLFDRFYRGSKSRNSADGGSGLGLAIAKEIVELHGGEIGVSSDWGHGSCFYFTLPLQVKAPQVVSVG